MERNPFIAIMRRQKEKMYELKFFVDQQEKEYTLTHIDAVPDNFLFVDDRIYLIDWEYSGMQVSTCRYCDVCNLCIV